MKNFLSMNDLEKADMEKIFETARQIKDDSYFPRPLCAGLLFDRPSTRTRVSFEVALRQLGMHPIYLDYVFSQLARGERIEDTGRVLSGYVNVIIARLHRHEMLEKLARASSVPIINGATDREHPCQALGDLFTIAQHGLLKPGTRLAYIGKPDGNVANSLIAGARKFGMEFIFIAPKGYAPHPGYGAGAKAVNDFSVKADIAYTSAFDVPEEELKAFLPFQLDGEKMKKTGAKFSMHPLPAYRGVEVSDEVLDSESCLAWEQAKNKVAVHKALVQHLLG